MTWHRTDDGFPKHRKSDALEDHFNGDWQHLALACEDRLLLHLYAMRG